MDVAAAKRAAAEGYICYGESRDRDAIAGTPRPTECEIRVRTDASLLENRDPLRAGIAAHVRGYSKDGRAVGGADIHMAVKVRDIHEAEQIALETGQYALTHPLLHDMFDVWGYPNGGRQAVTRIECFYDREGLFEGDMQVHGFAIAHLWERIHREYPSARLIRPTCVRRTTAWFRPVDAAAKKARFRHRIDRPIWLLPYEAGAIGRPGIAAFTICGSVPTDRFVSVLVQHPDHRDGWVQVWKPVPTAERGRSIAQGASQGSSDIPTGRCAHAELQGHGGRRRELFSDAPAAVQAGLQPSARSRADAPDAAATQTQSPTVPTVPRSGCDLQ